MIRYLLFVIILLTSISESDAQLFGGRRNRQYQYNPTENGGVRYCNNPNCIMCNRIFGPMPGYALTQEYRSVKATQWKAPLIAPPEEIVGGEFCPIPESSLQRLLYGNCPEDDPVLEPSSVKAVRAMLNIVKPLPNQTVYDLGCGDARILALAAKEYGANGVGVEINIDSVFKANELIDMMGVKDKVKIIHGDIRDFKDYGKADIITLYLFPDLLEQIIPNVKPGTTVISYGHDLPGVKTQKHIVKIDGDDYEFFVWKK